eukprot:SAG11_NODE_4097_length_2066_cov_1.152008_1_plen_196_part_01
MSIKTAKRLDTSEASRTRVIQTATGGKDKYGAYVMEKTLYKDGVAVHNGRVNALGGVSTTSVHAKITKQSSKTTKQSKQKITAGSSTKSKGKAGKSERTSVNKENQSRHRHDYSTTNTGTKDDREDEAWGGGQWADDRTRQLSRPESFDVEIKSTGKKSKRKDKKAPSQKRSNISAHKEMTFEEETDSKQQKSGGG